MPGVLGPTVMTTLGSIANALGLDYAGIDFALSADGRVVVFETNATMVVVRPEEDERWVYRQTPVQRVMDAVRKMLIDRAALA